MKRQWQFTLTRRVLGEPTRTTHHTYTVDSPQALNLLVQRASKDRDVVAYHFERVIDEQYRWQPCDCHGHLAKGNERAQNITAAVTPPNGGPRSARSKPA